MGAEPKDIFEQNVRDINCNQKEPCYRLPNLLRSLSANWGLDIQSMHNQFLTS